ncbi:MAG TPA: hypothetical protein VGJ74_23755 [Burkholderiales bacterium]|jgi:hypothetical protein
MALVAFGLLAPAAQAQELGRLFFTPEQRASLDARRKARIPDKPAAVVVAAPVTRLDGYVKRSAGPSTVWINGESVMESAPEAPRIDAGRAAEGAVSITIGEGGNRVRLKPGEALDRGNGEVHDVLGEGEIRVNPGKTAP